MKTNEADSPWDPKPEDPKVDGRLFKDGVDQLERDVLRFLELTPDIPMSSVSIATNLAFPMASESSERALTKEDFLTENIPQLLEKLGVPKEYLHLPERSLENPTSEDAETFNKIICRYLGAHAKVQSKIPMDQGVRALELAVTAHLLLSSQQREAIGRRHHLKFILGHYGSGKVIDANIWIFHIYVSYQL